MKKSFIESKLETDKSEHLENVSTNFAQAVDEKNWEEEVIRQFSSHSIDNIQSKFFQDEEIPVSSKSDFTSEMPGMLENEYLTNFISSFPVKSSNNFSCKKQPYSFIKNDQPSLFVHDNFFKKYSSQSSAAYQKFTKANSKTQAEQFFQCNSNQSLSSSHTAKKFLNDSSLSEAQEFKSMNFSSHISAFQNISMMNEEKQSADVNTTCSIVDGSKYISNYNFETSSAYKLSRELFSQFCEFSIDNSSESDNEEDDDEYIPKSITLPQKGIVYHPHKNSETKDGGALLAIEYDLTKEKIQFTLHKIALELLTTERTYVEILHLLDQQFAFRVDQENRVHNMFPHETVCQMFSNLKSLYKLHHDFLLPQLEERMSNWEKERHIGDIMKNFAPFLKMYTDYVKNYDSAMKLISLWYQKHPKFAQIMDEIHESKECKCLTLQHHMLTPIQRVPRYQLILKDYLKKLPDDSADKLDTEKALELVSIAANHSNETIKKIDKFKKLLEIQEMIGGVLDLVSPSRELLKEGKIIKISARSGDHQDRYLFLFSDLILLCSQRLISNKVVSGHPFRVRAYLNVEDLLVEEGDNLETANTFYIRTNSRVIELYTPTREDKMEWIKALTNAVSDLRQKKSSLKVSKLEMKEEKVQETSEFGRNAPNFIKLDSVPHCMLCDGPFSTFTFRRKHHCRACGIVVCNKCLPKKVPLPYDGGKLGRVCNSCYKIFIPDFKNMGERVCSPSRQKGILDVNPNDPAVINGYLQLKARSRFWVRRWFTLHDDFVLYSFNSHLDEVALTSMPVPGYTVGIPEKGENVDGRENVFKLFHAKKVYFFQAPSEEEFQRWLKALEKASKAE